MSSNASKLTTSGEAAPTPPRLQTQAACETPSNGGRLADKAQLTLPQHSPDKFPLPGSPPPKPVVHPQQIVEQTMLQTGTTAAVKMLSAADNMAATTRNQAARESPSTAGRTPEQAHLIPPHDNSAEDAQEEGKSTEKQAKPTDGVVGHGNTDSFEANRAVVEALPRVPLQQYVFTRGFRGATGGRRGVARGPLGNTTTRELEASPQQTTLCAGKDSAGELSGTELEKSVSGVAIRATPPRGRMAFSVGRDAFVNRAISGAATGTSSATISGAATGSSSVTLSGETSASIATPLKGTTHMKRLLSEDAFHDVLMHLPRGFLDQLSTVNTTVGLGLKRVSEPKTNKGPLRRVNMRVCDTPKWDHVTPRGRQVQLTMYDPEHQQPNDWKEVRCSDSDALQAAMKDCVVMAASFEVLDHAMLTQLLPFVVHWQHSRILCHPERFHSLALFARFFNQLALTTDELNIRFNLRRSFDIRPSQLWSFEAVKRCKRLNIHCMPDTALVTSSHVIEWTKLPHNDTSPFATKQLKISDGALATSKETFIEAIKADFENALVRTPPQYEILIRRLLCSVAPKSKIRMRNTVTSEAFEITDDGNDITLSRCVYYS